MDPARSQLAALLGCFPPIIVSTSGGSDANNPAIKGAFLAARDRGNHTVISRIEHPSTMEPCRYLERLGAEVTWIDDVVGRLHKLFPAMHSAA